MDQNTRNEILFDITNRIWKAYRNSTEAKNAKEFNDVFTPLTEIYTEPEFRDYICQIGGALAPFINKACAI